VIKEPFRIGSDCALGMRLPGVEVGRALWVQSPAIWVLLKWRKGCGENGILFSGQWQFRQLGLTYYIAIAL